MSQWPQKNKGRCCHLRWFGHLFCGTTGWFWATFTDRSWIVWWGSTISSSRFCWKNQGSDQTRWKCFPKIVSPILNTRSTVRLWKRERGLQSLSLSLSLSLSKVSQGIVWSFSRFLKHVSDIEISNLFCSYIWCSDLDLKHSKYWRHQCLMSSFASNISPNKVTIKWISIIYHISFVFSHAAVGGNPVYQLGRLNRCNWWGCVHLLISMGAVLSLATVSHINSSSRLSTSKICVICIIYIFISSFIFIYYIHICIYSHTPEMFDVHPSYFPTSWGWFILSPQSKARPVAWEPLVV